LFPFTNLYTSFFGFIHSFYRLLPNRKAYLYPLASVVHQNLHHIHSCCRSTDILLFELVSSYFLLRITLSCRSSMSPVSPTLRSANLHFFSFAHPNTYTSLAVALGCTLTTTLHITDQFPMFELMKQNITLNGLDSKVSASIYDWGESVPVTIPQHPDIILAADCVYFEPAFPLLQKTLQDLIGDSTYRNISYCIPNVSNNMHFLLLQFLYRTRLWSSGLNSSCLSISFPLSCMSPQSRSLTLFLLDTICYFCFKRRRRADLTFMKTARKLFDVEDVMDDVDREIWSREKIFLQVEHDGNRRWC
jgi:hypothetical protein